MLDPLDLGGVSSTFALSAVTAWSFGSSYSMSNAKGGHSCPPRKDRWQSSTATYPFSRCASRLPQPSVR